MTTGCSPDLAQQFYKTFEPPQPLMMVNHYLRHFRPVDLLPFGEGGALRAYLRGLPG